MEQLPFDSIVVMFLRSSLLIITFIMKVGHFIRENVEHNFFGVVPLRVSGKPSISKYFESNFEYLTSSIECKVV